MDISCKIGDGKFNYRVVYVLMHNNKILLTTDDSINFWSLPGGRVKMFESSMQALKRELFEELGEKPIYERLLWVTENMFYLDVWESNCHELCFYYLVELTNDSKIYQQDLITVDDELVDGARKKLTFKWFEIDTLEEVNLKPAWIKKRFNDLPISTEHVVFNELDASLPT